jgi:hypothetical protein
MPTCAGATICQIDLEGISATPGSTAPKADFGVVIRPTWWCVTPSRARQNEAVNPAGPISRAAFGRPPLGPIVYTM